jgi:hypothetical protein
MADLRILELRIHGIANAPPADVLLTTKEQVERKDGDDQGSFWRITSKSPGGSDYSAADVDVVAEAYWWGNQARSGGTALALVGRAFVHVGWLFVLPFGLCNLAYWARRDIKGTNEARTWWAGGDGAIAVRVFALLQTLFYTVGFLTVFVHLVGLQCFRAVITEDGGTEYLACASLPSWLDFLALWSPISRAALFSIGPVAVILLIFLIGLRARGQFNPKRSFDDVPQQRPKPLRSAEERADDVDPPRPPLLASPGFWNRKRVEQSSERAHFAAAIALIVLVLAADVLLDRLPGRDQMGVESLAPLVGAAAGAVLLCGAIAITAASGLSGRIWSARSKRSWSTVLLGASVLAYGLWLLWALQLPAADGAGEASYPGDNSLRGLIIAPTVIAAVGALIAVESLAWGYKGRRIVIRFLPPLALACIAASELWAKNLGSELGWLRPALSWTALALVALAVAVAYLPFKDAEVREARRFAGWHGNGAAVTLLLALFSSLVITSLLVLGARAWLTADNDEPQIKDGWRTVDLTPGAAIATPAFYERFAGMLVIVMAVLLGVGVLAAIVALRRLPAFSLPGPTFDPELGGTRGLIGEYPPAGSAPGSQAVAEATADPHAPKVVLEKEYPPIEDQSGGRLRAVAEARRIAALAHRGEPMLRVVAILSALALVPLGIPYFGELLQQSIAWTTLSTVSVWAIGLLALAVTAWVVMNAVTSTERPLGLVWDIICFFPRAGHPFTPPCYAERAVPEVSKRVKRWMEEDPHNSLILSAHSMGAAIAVGAIMSMHGEGADESLHRVALLTHGAQLRAYFSRFFPEVFGARVLGVRGTSGPVLFGADPWREQVIEDSRRPAGAPQKDGDPPSVVRVLGGDFRDPNKPIAPRWRSLWRRTDYLGFPITGFWSNETDGVNENPIDRGATERSPRSYLWAVARHNDYLSTPQYRAARDELVEMLKRQMLNGGTRR